MSCVMVKTLVLIKLHRHSRTIVVHFPIMLDVEVDVRVISVTQWVYLLSR